MHLEDNIPSDPAEFKRRSKAQWEWGVEQIRRVDLRKERRLKERRTSLILGDGTLSLLQMTLPLAVPIVPFAFIAATPFPRGRGNRRPRPEVRGPGASQ